MFPQPLWSFWAVPTLAAGVYWISQAAVLPWGGALPVALVGFALVASGGGQLFAPGERRLTQLGALAGLVGLVFSLPCLFIAGVSTAVALAITAVGGAWGAGRSALHAEPHTAGVPTPEATAGLAARVAADEMILGLEYLTGASGFALDGTLERAAREVEEMAAFCEAEGFARAPATYHVAPPALSDPEIRRRVVAGRSIEVLRFESGYAPRESEPGRERWLGYDACRDAWAYVLRHEGEPRPWLIATNGYRMGHAGIDVRVFERFFRADEGLGLNVLIPVLPLHGPRRTGLHSGEGFIGLDVIDTLHAETQALWDMRRLLSWVRDQEAPRVGAFGLSLGGLTTANFASLAEGLSAVVPGIPLVDLRRVIERHAASHQARYARALGYDFDRVSEVLRVISPLALAPRVPIEGRLLFAATADRLVPPEQAVDLWRHWEQPELVWYQGGHVSFSLEREVWQAVDRKLHERLMPA